MWSLLAVGTFGTYLFERFWRDTAWFAFELANRKLSPFVSSFFHILVATALGILATLAYKLVTGMFKSLFKTKKEARGEKDRIVYTVPEEDISDLEEIETLLVHNASEEAGKDRQK